MFHYTISVTLATFSKAMYCSLVPVEENISYFSFKEKSSQLLQMRIRWPLGT